MDGAPPSAADPSTSTQTLDVFVSYAREDREFVVRLTDALRARGRTAWVDLEGIPPSADYALEIEDAIVRAQAYVFVASSDSAQSAACAAEAATAVRHNKKIVPIVAQEVDAGTLPAAVASRQWINAQSAQDFERSVDALVSAVDTDLAWIRTHTRLLGDALRWHADHDGTSLLEGRELEDAEAWLRAAELHEAQPTPEQTAFIAASRWAASLARAQRHYEVAFELSGAGRRQAAAAHLLRAVELSPPDGIPAGYPVSPERPGWAADAWSAFRYLDAQRGHLVGRLRVPAAVSCLAADPSGTVIAVGCMSGAVTLWDLERCSMISDLEGIGDTVTAVAVAPDREVVAAGADGSLLAWAAHADAPRSLLRSSGNPVTAIALAPDGRRAFGLRDGHVLLRDAAGNDVHQTRLHTGSITSLAFDAEGRLLTGSGRPPSGNWLGDGTSIAWEPQQDERRPLLFGTLEGAPVAAVPSPDAGAALRSLAGGTVELWSVSPGERRLLGHPETVRAVAFSAAGDVAITGGDDGTVRTWDVDTGARQESLDAHLGPVTCVAQTADGRLLLSGSLDASVAVWVVDREDARAALTDDGGAIAVSPNDDIAVGASGGAVQLLDAGGVPVATLGRSGPVMSVAVSPDGDTVLAGHEDGAVAVWDARSRTGRAVLTGHDGIVWELAFSPDGMLAGSACDDGTARLWDTADWTPRATLAGHDGAVHGVAFTPDGGQVVTCGGDGTARLWSTDGAMDRILGRAQRPLTSVAVTPDAGSVVASADDGVVHVWDAEAAHGLPRRRRGERTFEAHDRLIRRIALSADGRVLLTASFDATVNCWELASGRKLQEFTGHKDSVYGVAIVDGRVYSAGADGTVWVWDVGADHPVGSYSLSPRRASGVAVSADGTTMAASTLEGDVYAWETARFHEPATLAVGHTAQVDGLAFNADGSLLASVARDRTVRLWRSESADQVIAERLGASATSVAWHPSGRRLVCGTGDKREVVESSDAFGAVGGRIARTGPASGGAIVWDFHAGPPRFLERHAGPVQAIAITSDGRIVTGGDDASVRVWAADSGRQLRLLEGHRDRVWAVAVSPDGALAATGSIDNDVRLWQLESGACTRVIEHHSAGVGSVAFTRQGALLVTASADGSVRLIEVATGEEVRALRGHDGGVAAVAVDAAGRRALSGTMGGELLLWDMSGADPPRALTPHAELIGSWLSNVPSFGPKRYSRFSVSSRPISVTSCSATSRIRWRESVVGCDSTSGDAAAMAASKAIRVDSSRPGFEVRYAPMCARQVADRIAGGSARMISFRYRTG